MQTASPCSDRERLITPLAMATLGTFSTHYRPPHVRAEQNRHSLFPVLIYCKVEDKNSLPPLPVFLEAINKALHTRWSIFMRTSPNLNLEYFFFFLSLSFSLSLSLSFLLILNKLLRFFLCHGHKEQQFVSRKRKKHFLRYENQLMYISGNSI